MKKMISLGLFLCLSALLIQPVAAEEGKVVLKEKAGKSAKDGYDPKVSFEKFSKKLKLNPDQKEKIRTLLNDEVQALHAVRQEAMDREMKIIETNRGKVNALLTPEQQKTFNAMRDARLQKCRKDHDRHHAMESGMLDHGDLDMHGEGHGEGHGEEHKAAMKGREDEVGEGHGEKHSEAMENHGEKHEMMETKHQ